MISLGLAMNKTSLTSSAKWNIMQIQVYNSNDGGMISTEIRSALTDARLLVSRMK